MSLATIQFKNTFHYTLPVLPSLLLKMDCLSKFLIRGGFIGPSDLEGSFNSRRPRLKCANATSPAINAQRTKITRKEAIFLAATILNSRISN